MISLERRAGRPLRIGHRGAAALAPENTLRAFRAALEAGVDLIEFDVLELASGELVIAHSNDLREVSHGAARGSVRDRKLEDLREVCPELPTLDQALGFFVEEAGDIGVHIDLKSAGAVGGVVSALHRFGLVERSFVSSHHARVLRDLQRFEPRVRTGVSFPQDRLGIHGKKGIAHVVSAGLHALRLVTPQLAATLLARSGASALVLHQDLVTASAVRRAHGCEAAVVAWTVDDVRDLERVDAAGVDAVVANDPTIFRSTLRT